MNKYNIKVGDYVETIQEGMGWVSSVEKDGFNWIITKKNNNSAARDVGSNVYCEFSNIEKYYNRIGENVIPKKKAKLKPISGYNQNGIVTYVDKLNELINHINAIQERLNEGLANE